MDKLSIEKNIWKLKVSLFVREREKFILRLKGLHNVEKVVGEVGKLKEHIYKEIMSKFSSADKNLVMANLDSIYNSFLMDFFRSQGL